METQTAFVRPGQLCEHLAPGGARVIMRNPIGTRTIIPARSSYAINRKTNTRIDRVEGGFLVYHGKIRDLKAIAPRLC